MHIHVYKYLNAPTACTRQTSATPKPDLNLQSFEIQGLGFRG